MNTTKDAILYLIQSNEPRYTRALEQARKEADTLINGFSDSSDLVSAWGHFFTCPDCGANLIFDENIKNVRGAVFTCSSCKKKAKGEKLEGAWVFYMRHTAAIRLRSAAILALLGDEKAVKFIEKFMNFYAESYAFFERHGNHGTNNGKLMPQILDESVWATNVSLALYICRALFPKTLTEYWYEKIFAPLIDLIDEPRDGRVFIHNHILWHKCAVGAIALAFDKKELLRHALDDASGVRQQLDMGLTNDGLWFECSTSYHYYAMRALGTFCAMLAHEHPDDPLCTVFGKAMLAPLKLSHDGKSIPSFNDGTYPLFTDAQAELFFYAYAAKPSVKIGSVLGAIEKRNPNAFIHPITLLFAKFSACECASEADEMPPIELLSDTRLAVIRKPVFAVLKAGSLKEWHRHLDMLSIVLPPFSDDLGTCRYGHPLYEGYYAQAVSHNTVTVDLKQPSEVLETHVEETECGIRAVVDGGWDGVRSAERTLTAVDSTLYDEVSILCDGEHTLDFILHFDGENDLSGTGGSETTLGEAFGYQYIQNAREILADELTFSVKSGADTLLVALECKDFRVFVGESPSNPASQMRTTVILRAKADKARFLAKYSQA